MHIHAVAHHPIETQVWEPVLDLAAASGFKTTSGEANVHADIGLYCGDKAVPGPQSFTVVTINGLDQDHRYREKSDYWRFFSKQGWGNFDFGFLPNPRWLAHLVNRPSDLDTFPRFGAAMGGWPKSDDAYRTWLGDEDSRASEPYPSSFYRLLYAPQSGAEQDFAEVRDQVHALRESTGFDLRLRVKFWQGPQTFLDFLKQKDKSADEIEERLATYHRWRIGYPFDSWIEVMDPDSNIYQSLRGVDWLLTDQSSVLYDALVLAVPAIVITSHVHKGRLPSGEAFVLSEVRQLSKTLEHLYSSDVGAREASLLRRDTEFPFLGRSAPLILATILDQYEKVKGQASEPGKATLPTRIPIFLPQRCFSGFMTGQSRRFRGLLGKFRRSWVGRVFAR